MEEAPQACALDVELVEQVELSGDSAALGMYPINAARNRALMLARSELLLLLDVDFLPATSLREAYASSETYCALAQQLVGAQAAAVLPAFGHADHVPSAASGGADVRYDNVAVWLAGKAGVVEAYTQQQLPGFYERQVPAGQGPTDFRRWLTATHAYAIEYKQYFEPYVLVAQQHVPWYDERFVGYHRNKVQHCEHMHGLGLQFTVHPAAYVVHVAHAKSPAFHATHASEHRDRMTRLYAEVQRDIALGVFAPVASSPKNCAVEVLAGR
jgi:glycosyltransferase-like protein LARGE